MGEIAKIAHGVAGLESKLNNITKALTSPQATEHLSARGMGLRSKRGTGGDLFKVSPTPQPRPKRLRAGRVGLSTFKGDDDQPRVPAGSPEGGQWAGTNVTGLPAGGSGPAKPGIGPGQVLQFPDLRARGKELQEAKTPEAKQAAAKKLEAEAKAWEASTKATVERYRDDPSERVSYEDRKYVHDYYAPGRAGRTSIFASILKDAAWIVGINTAIGLHSGNPALAATGAAVMGAAAAIYRGVQALGRVIGDRIEVDRLARFVRADTRTSYARTFGFDAPKSTSIPKMMDWMRRAREGDQSVRFAPRRGARKFAGLTKGHPDQPRDEDGKWTDGGGSGSDVLDVFGADERVGRALTIRNRLARAAVAIIAGLGIAHLPMGAMAVKNVMSGKPWYQGVMIPEAELERYENEKAFEGLKAKGYRFERQPDGTYRVKPPATAKYREDQARGPKGSPEGGQFVAEGDGGGDTKISAKTAIDAVRSSADNLLRTRTMAAANRFVEVTKDVMGHVADGLFDDDASFWRRMLALVSTVFQTLAAGADAIGIGTAVGIGVGSVAGASAGLAVASALAAWITYEKWSEKREVKRSKREVATTRARISDLEEQLYRLQRRRRSRA